ncbi:hypothetical protein LSAT2_021725 [Lamellibrachia satsuma]|nr:hypothetical protein LSAT2_021725 [Lamellibrachia satsuma]
MCKTKDLNSTGIELSQLHISDDEAPVSEKSQPSKARRVSIESARSDRSKPATKRAGRDRWRKVVDIVAPKTARAKLGKTDAPSASPRRRTKTEWLIILFQARKSRLDSELKNGFEDPEHPAIETSTTRRQSKEQVISLNMTKVNLNESLRPVEKSNGSTRDVKLPEITMSTSPDVASPAKDIKQIAMGGSGENVAITIDGVTVCDKSAQTAPQVVTPHGRFFVGQVPTSGKDQADALKLEHAIHARGFSCHDRALRDAGYTPHVDKSNTVKWFKERSPADSKTMVADSRSSSAGETVTVSTPPHGNKPSRDVLSTTEKVTTKVKPAARTNLEIKQHHSVRLSSKYDKLLHYLTLVRDYPEAFEKLRHLAANESTSPASVRHLMKMGRVFTTGHREFGRRETPVQIAAYELGSRHKLSACALAPPKEAQSSLPHPTAHGTLGKNTNTRSHSAISAETDSSEPSCLPDAKRMQAQHGAVVAGLWRAREDAEKALASVSTYQGQLETEMALEALEEADGSQQQWWVSQKHCRYLRGRGFTDVSS